MILSSRLTAVEIQRERSWMSQRDESQMLRTAPGDAAGAKERSVISIRNDIWGSMDVCRFA